MKIVKQASLSECGKYRYLLERHWLESGSIIAWVMVNPSTADAEVDDPTIRKCIRFSIQFGYAGMRVVNLFALRSTDPLELAKATDPIGSLNDQYIMATVAASQHTMVAWGKHGALRGRDKAVVKLLDLARTTSLRNNLDGSPQHPLYIPFSAKPSPWAPPEKMVLPT